MLYQKWLNNAFDLSLNLTALLTSSFVRHHCQSAQKHQELRVSHHATGFSSFFVVSNQSKTLCVQEASINSLTRKVQTTAHVYCFILLQELVGCKEGV